MAESVQALIEPATEGFLCSACQVRHMDVYIRALSNSIQAPDSLL